MLATIVALIIAAEPAPAVSQGAAQRPPANPDRMICRSRPKLGSRIARERICRTAAEWQAYEQDLAAARRDAQSTGLEPTARNEGLFPCTPAQPC